MKVVAKGYGKEGYEILLIPGTEAERKEFMDSNLSVGIMKNHVMGIIRLSIDRF